MTGGSSAAAMEGDHAAILERLLADGILKQCRYSALARLLPHLRLRTCVVGEHLFAVEAPADHLFLVVSGRVELVTPLGRRHVVKAGGRVGDEAGTEVRHYLATAEATEPLTVVSIPREKLREALIPTPEVQAEFSLAIMRTFSGEAVAVKSTSAIRRAAARVPASIAFGWLLTALAPPAIWYAASSAGLQHDAALFCGIFSAAVLMWIFKLADEYVPGLFVLLAAICVGMAPAKVVFSGFASDGFFMAMSILGLGTVIIASGLSYRASLLLLRWLPRNQIGLHTGLIGMGTLLTPILPTANGRVALMAPILNDLVEVLRLKPGGKVANHLAVATFTGATLFSGMFLTSKSVNFVVFGMMSTQMQEQYQWVGWLVASAAVGLAMLLAYVLLVVLFFRNREPVAVSCQMVAAQLRLLGPLKQREWAAIAGIVLFVLGIISFSAHAIPPPWIGLTILYGLLLCGSLTKKEFRQQVDWPFLVYLATIVGIVGLINAVGLDALIARHLAAVGTSMRTDFAGFILVLAALTFVLRLAMPINATIVILAAVFLPLADHAGINQWVVGFIILVLGEMWMFPYQCSYYLQFQELTVKDAYTEATFLRFNLLINVVKIAAIYASIPFWKLLGLL